MKKTLLFAMFISSIVIMTSCEKDLMDYQGESSIYFDVRRGNEWRDSTFWARQYYTQLNFIDKIGDALEVELPVAISGPVTDWPRSFRVEVVKDSTTAVEGVDFDFQREWTLPAGAALTHIKLVVYRQADLEDTLRTVMLRVQDNENFTTRLNFDKDLPGRDNILDGEKKYSGDPRFHTVELTLSIKKPVDWWGFDYPKTDTYPGLELDVLGAFSSKKYLLMLQVLGYSEAMFCEAIKTKDRARIVDEIFGRYLVQQFDKGEPVLEKDGRLMWVQSVQTIHNKKWMPYQYEW